MNLQHIAVNIIKAKQAKMRDEEVAAKSNIQVTILQWQ